MKKILLASLLATLATAASAAAPRNQIPSCYAANKIELPVPAPERDVFILLDQTVLLDADLKQSLADSARALLTPGTSFTILRFSAFSQGRYLDVVASGTLEKPIAKQERGSVGVKVLKTFDSCMTGQQNYGLKLGMSAIGSSIQQSSGDLGKSDVIGSLSETSRIVKASQAPRRVVFIVSDMLENSSISSFYANNGVKKIAPEQELKTVEANRMFGDFGAASVFVMGAGMIAESPGSKDAKKAQTHYRDPKTMAALKQFWGEYFKRSNASLEEFGTPALLSPVH